jgi:hypothetical protein
MDSHDLLEAWLAEGADGDPPREVAVHAAVCDSCARRLGAFDAMGLVDVAAAGSPPPVPARSRVDVGLAWARVGAAIAGTVVAGILVVFAASQLVGFVGSLPAPTDGVALGSASLEPGTSDQGSSGPEPAEEPSVAGPTPTAIPSFIPLPSLEPQATPLPAPATPSLFRGAVTQSTIAISWTNGSGGGPVQKWEVWRRTGSGAWLKLGELQPNVHALTNGGLAPGTTYSYRVRAVNVSWFGQYSNIVSGTTLSAPPTPAPSATPSPLPTPAPRCSDGADNDGDGWTDWPDDPGCGSAADDDESPSNPHECNNALDDDGDGYTDAADPACSFPFDDSEAPPDPHQCNDGIDNDSDGWTDAADPACSFPFDDSEAPQDPHQCNDGIDNDGDLLTDFPNDPGCSDAFDDSEDTA